MIVRYYENIANLVSGAFTPRDSTQRIREISAYGIPLLDNHLEVTQVSYDGGGYHRSYWLSDLCEIKVTLARYLKINAMSRGYVIDINSPHFIRFWENLYYRQRGAPIFPVDVKGMYFCCEGAIEVLLAMGFDGHKPLTMGKSANVLQICEELGIQPYGMEAAFVVGPIYTRVYSTVSDDIGTLIALRYPELVINPNALSYISQRKGNAEYP